MDQARLNATSQSPHATLTCLVARMMAPHLGQEYLRLQFLLVACPPPFTVIVVSLPSSLSSFPFNLIWKTVLRLAVKSSMSDCWASHSAVWAVRVVTVHS